MYVQNANVIIKFTRGIFPTLIMHEYLVEIENIKTSKITKITFTRYILKRPFLIWGPQTLWGPWIDFWVSVNLDGKRITTLYSLITK